MFEVVATARQHCCPLLQYGKEFTMQAFRHLVSSFALVALVVLAVIPGASGASAQRATNGSKQTGPLQGQPFTIESWLYASSPAKRRASPSR